MDEAAMSPVWTVARRHHGDQEQVVVRRLHARSVGGTGVDLVIGPPTQANLTLAHQVRAALTGAYRTGLAEAEVADAAAIHLAIEDGIRMGRYQAAMGSAHAAPQPPR